jgi:thiol-disulfide isomerase/thioredoxin
MESPNLQTPEPPTPKGASVRNLIVAMAAVILATALFLGVRTQSHAPSLTALAEEAVPLEVALTNGQPTLLEFYANWCTSCQSMAPMMAGLEQQYHDRLNFVMLNVDNDKWLPELLRYRVDGIPHFVFLNAQGEAIAQTIGEQPRSIMAANLEALLVDSPLPYARSTGRTSTVNSFFAPDRNSVIDPRSHGSQIN